MSAHDLSPGPRAGALMGVASMCMVQLGSALTVPLFDRLGAAGAGGLRLAWAGVLLLVLVRPRRRDFTGRDLGACAVLGAATAGMMLFFMLAIDHLPLGTASALEFLGPLGVSLLGPGGGRKRWTVAAAAGVALLTEPWHGGVDAAGLCYALAAAACWATYILFTQRVGDRVTGLSGLAVSMPVAGVTGLLVSAPSLTDRLTWQPVLVMLALAVLSPVLPFALEFLALRRLTASAFGTLMSLEPAFALLIGLLVLGQVPGPGPAAGVALVVTAGVGATRSGARPAPAPPVAPPSPGIPPSDGPSPGVPRRGAPAQDGTPDADPAPASHAP